MGSTKKPLLWLGVLLFTIALVPSPTLTKTLDDSAPSKAEAIVITKSGAVVGIQTKTQDDTFVNVYYGIPYAQPPVKELRFRPPLPVSPWTSTLDATKTPLACYQEIPAMFNNVKEMRLAFQRPWTEDCLTLSIWAPEPKPQKAPVMVFFHGGGFVFGSSVSNVDGSRLVAEGLVVVSVNYRLGAFGFLRLGTPEVPGNMGLMDQNRALQWVRDNIEAFGGDPEAVTISGISAGGASVGFHLLSPMSRGLFKRAILMSGVPTNNFATREPEATVAKSERLLDFVICKDANATLALACIQKAHPEEILFGGKAENDLNDDSFVPTIDGKLVVEHPSVSLSAGRVNPAEIMVGTAYDEGAEFMKGTNPTVFKTSDGRLFRRDVLSVIKRVQKGISDLQAEALNQVYTDWSNPDDPLMLRDAFKDMYSDAGFLCHVNEFSYVFARLGHPVYRYVFKYNMDLFKTFTKRNDWIGASHGDDQMPVLGPQMYLQYLSPTDLLVSKKMVKYFANFVKDGDPNLSSDFPGEPKWPRLNSTGEHNLIDVTSSVAEDSRRKECAAWLTLLPLLDQANGC